MTQRAEPDHVAILASNFWPEPTGASQTTTEFSVFLALRGWRVRVATSMPYYPQWEIWPDYRGRLWRSDEYQGVQIYRSWHFVRPRVSSATRILDEATLSLLALPNMVRVLRGAKAAYIVTPALSYAFTGSIVAKLLGVRRVLVVKDVMPDAAVELGMLKNKAIIKISRWLARRTYALADEIHTLGEGMQRRVARDAEADKVRIVPDTVDGDELAPVPRERNEFRRRFVPDGTFAVLHTGNMGRKQDLDLVLRTADRLRENPVIRFYVFGDGAVKPAFLNRREEMRLENVEHYPLQERWFLPHMLSGADAVLISQLPEVVDIVVPSKLLTALAAGAMIVAACASKSETANLVRASGGGLIVPASDDAELASTILALQRGEVKVADYRKRARDFALRAFDRAAVYGRLADEWELQLQRRPAKPRREVRSNRMPARGRDER